VELKARAGHVIIGGGVLGLSTAWWLAERGADVLVLEKSRVGAGASGAAGGIVRNFYRSPAMADLVRDSVEIFEAEPDAYGFRQVGYLAAVPQAQVDERRRAVVVHDHRRPELARKLLRGGEVVRVGVRIDEVVDSQAVARGEGQVAIDLAQFRVDQRRSAGVLAADQVGLAAAGRHSLQNHCYPLLIPADAAGYAQFRTGETP
jgi:glycine/D-amino acid oxidase-like deaminating enzyme